MITISLTILVCACAYAIKGGSGNILKNWNYVRDKNKIYDRLLDGKVLSTIVMFVVAGVGTGWDMYMTCAIALAWLVSVAPSIGEENGSIGDHNGAWGTYIERGFPRDYGIKKGVQRGLVFGAAFAAVTSDINFIWFSLAFVPATFIGQCLNYLVLKKRGWTLAEPIIGAIVVGVPLGIYFLNN